VCIHSNYVIIYVVVGPVVYIYAIRKNKIDSKYNNDTTLDYYPVLNDIKLISKLNKYKWGPFGALRPWGPKRSTSNNAVVLCKQTYDDFINCFRMQANYVVS